MLAKNLTTSKSNYKNRGRTLYSSKNYENPFFKQRKAKIKWSVRKAASSIVLVLFMSLGLSVTYSSYFKASSIEINGLADLDPNELQRSVWSELDKGEFSLYPKRNLLFIRQGKLEDFLKETYSLQAVNVNKSFPSRLLIEAVERTPAAVWLENEKYYFIDDNGNTIKETDPLNVDMSVFPVIHNSTGRLIEGKKIAYDSSYILASKKLLDYFNSKKDEYQIKEFELRNDFSLSAVFLKGPQVDFNTNNELDKQLQKLEVLKKEKLLDSFYTKSYINVGIGDTVYVR